MAERTRQSSLPKLISIRRHCLAYSATGRRGRLTLFQILCSHLPKIRPGRKKQVYQIVRRLKHIEVHPFRNIDPIFFQHGCGIGKKPLLEIFIRPCLCHDPAISFLKLTSVHLCTPVLIISDYIEDRSDLADMPMTGHFSQIERRYIGKAQSLQVKDLHKRLHGLRILLIPRVRRPMRVQREQIRNSHLVDIKHQHLNVGRIRS